MMLMKVGFVLLAGILAVVHGQGGFLNSSAKQSRAIVDYFSISPYSMLFHLFRRFPKFEVFITVGRV